MMNRLFTVAFACMTVTYINTWAQSPYISTVYDFCPAPGQLVNSIPEYNKGDTHGDMIRKAGEAIANNARGLISLGGYGGYVVFGFDHAIRNVEGKYDFKVTGNAFHPTGDGEREAGSCEPGIVMVAMDTNGDGLPNDTWYELAGSEYRKPETVHDFRITYQRPDENKARVPDPRDNLLNDITYIRWTTNGYGDGYIFRNAFHNQPYFPQWVEEEEITFTGARLANNGVDLSGTGRNYVLYAYPWGYADNHPDSDHRANFSIDWAVDEQGNAVHLPHIDFVKVYTAVNQYCGWIGETSTEVSGAEDLHLTGGDIDVPFTNTGNVKEPRMQSQRVYCSDGNLHIEGFDGYECRILSTTGQSVKLLNAKSFNYISTCNLPAGLYIFHARKGNNVVTIKFIIKFAT